MSGTVVVGYDGSAPARWALTWASVEASRRGSALHVAAVVDRAAVAGCPAAHLVRRWRALQAQAQRLAADADRLVGGAVSGGGVRVLPEVGAPVSTLVAASRHADVLVLGRQRSALASRFGRGIVESVVEQARCPVLVVGSPHAAHPGPTHPVVVGVDGSAHSDRALEVAASASLASGAPLIVVCVFRSPAPDPSERAQRPAPTCDVLAEQTARQVAEDAVTRARSVCPGIDAQAVVQPGHPPAVLLRLAQGAGLLVLGRRGLGERSSLLVGSVCRTALEALPCPVTVVDLSCAPHRVSQEAREQHRFLAATSPATS